MLFGFQEKENSRDKRKTRELCILLSVKHNIYVSCSSRGDFYPLYSLYKSKILWLVTYKDNQGSYIKKIHKKRSKVESAKIEENLHHAWAVRIWKVLCEFRTTWRCCANFKVLCEFRISLEQLSSEGHIFLISAPNHTRFEALDSWLPELWNGI